MSSFSCFTPSIRTSIASGPSPSPEETHVTESPSELGSRQSVLYEMPCLISSNSVFQLFDWEEDDGFEVKDKKKSANLNGLPLNPVP